MTGSTFETDLERLLAEEPFVRRLARGLLFDEHAVDDVVQQTWMAALRNPPTGIGTPRAWIAGVVRRLAANRVRGDVRRRRREQAAAEAERDHPSADELLLREERRRTLVDALQALAEPYRSAVALRYLEGLEPAEIARQSGVPATTVRSHVRRGLGQMRAHLDARHGGDRAAWCTAMLPLAAARPKVTTGVATTLLGAAAMQKLFAVAAFVAAALFAWSFWPAGPESQAPVVVVDSSPPPAPAEPVLSAPAEPERVAATALPDATTSPGPVDVHAGALHGRLLAPDGAPLPRARLDAFALDGAALFDPGAELPGASARTRDDGTFELAGLPMQAYVGMVADADGDLRQLVPLPASPAAGEVVELGDIVLEARASLTGVVVDDDGEAVAGAEVWSADMPALVLAALPVDRLDPANGLVVVMPRPSAEQLNDLEQWHDAAQRHLAREIVATDYGELSEQRFLPLVVEGGPIESLWRRLPFARATTDADGRFRLRGVPPGANMLVARHGGFAPAVRGRCNARLDRENDVGTLRLGAGETLLGRVRDAEGAPVVGAEVRAAQLGLLGFRGLAPCEPAVVTGADGAFEVAGLGRTDVVVAWRVGPDQPWRVEGPVASDDEVELLAPAPVAVPLHVRVSPGVDRESVRLLARPSPPLGELSRLGVVAGYAEVELVGSIAAGDAHVVLAPGVWTLRLEADGCAPATRVVDVQVERTVEFVLAPSAALHVMVRDSLGAPCADAEVYVQADDAPDAGSVAATSYGLATFSGSWPIARARTGVDGRAELSVRSGALRVSARCGARGSAVKDVELGSATDVVLQLTGTGAVAGRLEVGPALGGDPRAYRIAVAPSWQMTDAGPIAAEATVRPAADGTFRIDGLPPGSYRATLLDPLPRAITFVRLVELMQARASLFGEPDVVQTAGVEIVAGADAELHFAVGGLDPSRGGVQGVVMREDRSAEELTIWARDRQRFGAGGIMDAGWESRPRAMVGVDGTFLVDDLQPRTWWFGVREGRDGPFVHAFQIEVAAGVRATVQAEVRLGSVRGRLLRENGAPAADVDVYVHVGEDASTPLVTRMATTDAQGLFDFEGVPAGPCLVGVLDRHLRVDTVEFSLLPGGATPPLELQGHTRYRLNVTLAADVATRAGKRYGLGLRRAGRTGAGSTSMGHRSADFAVDEPGPYEVLVRIDDTWYLAEPSPVFVQELEQAVEVRPGRRVELR